MKNAIAYYYNLIPSNIHQYNKIYKFEINNTKYIMYPYDRNIDDLSQIYSLHLTLLNNGFYCHQILLNNNKEILTIINNIPYILLKILIEDKKIELYDIETINNIYVDEKNFLKLKKDKWYNLWIQKIDYFEYQISQLGMKYPTIRISSDYFIGIVENCIALLYEIDDHEIVKTVCHNRINKYTTTIDLYNPINLIIDYKIRDIGEYFKIQILDDAKIIDKIKQYIYLKKLNNRELRMLFIRLMYPSFYFDTCEKIINYNLEEKNINDIIDKIVIYEHNLKDIYSYFKMINVIPEIEWLKKK